MPTIGKIRNSYAFFTTSGTRDLCHRLACLSLVSIMYAVTLAQFSLVYNMLSFTLACMSATTVFLFVRISAVRGGGGGGGGRGRGGD